MTYCVIVIVAGLSYSDKRRRQKPVCDSGAPSFPVDNI